MSEMGMVGVCKMKFTNLATRRDQPVICARAACARRVERRSRNQLYCSKRCRQKDHARARIYRAAGLDPIRDRPSEMGAC
jgi:hypothetical protein